MEQGKIDEMKRSHRKELETQAALNKESYYKMKEKRAQNGWKWLLLLVKKIVLVYLIHSEHFVILYLFCR